MGLLQGNTVNEKGRKDETSPPSENGLRLCITERSALLSLSMPGWLFVGRPDQRINPEAVVSERDPLF